MYKIKAERVLIKASSYSIPFNEIIMKKKLK